MHEEKGGATRKAPGFSGQVAEGLTSGSKLGVLPTILARELIPFLRLMSGQQGEGRRPGKLLSGRCRQLGEDGSKNTARNNPSSALVLFVCVPCPINRA